MLTILGLNLYKKKRAKKKKKIEEEEIIAINCMRY